MMKGLFLLGFVFLISCSKGYDKPATISQVIKAHEQSQSFHDWLENPLNPKELLKNQKFSCNDLEKLNVEKLVIFYSALDSEVGKQAIPGECRLKLIEKIENYYLAKEQQGLNVNVNAVKAANTKDTRKVHVDTTGGPVFWYGERGGLDKKEVALTFDDGPHPRLTPILLKILDEFNIKATFFVLGKNVKTNPEIIQQIRAHGHRLANHTHSHHNLPKYSFKHGVNEIEKGFDELFEVTSKVEPFFRFPYGARTKSLQNYLRKTNVATFFWDVDTLDWKKTNPSELLEYSTHQVYKYNNGIILFHDIQPQTISVMRDFLTELLINDYSFAQYVND